MTIQLTPRTMEQLPQRQSHSDMHRSATSVVRTSGGVKFQQNIPGETVYAINQPIQQYQTQSLPQQFLQQQQPEYASGAPHAIILSVEHPTYNQISEPVSQDMSGYATYAAAAHHHTSAYTAPQFQQQLQFQPQQPQQYLQSQPHLQPQPQLQQQPQPQPQPQQYQQPPPPLVWPSHHAPSYSDYENRKTETEKYQTSATSSKADTEKGKKANGLINCLKDSICSIAFEEIVPIVTVVGSALTHHYRHRKSKTMIPYSKSRWIKYVDNALFGYNIYTFAKENGFINQKNKDAARELSWDNKETFENLTSHVKSRNIDNTRSEISIERMVQIIVGSLFKNNCGNNLMDQFDNSWAVNIETAEYFHNSVYCRKLNLCNTNAQVLGGAAAVQALQSERQMTLQQEYIRDVQHRTPEHMVMKLALSEANALLFHKSAIGILNVDDILENVGKIALATIIKFKIDEEWPPSVP
ncbi:hypothetical protein COEREDRAFT_89812 [Coemansia reversa NRRL 1564]|uniref:Uncharacterized protein n=1 Tax=Coemansia reversa (strain ATCC 12441 / NRRL 1564) TaxID=763665 RepID=A0A2G5B264_COERN|nr:hypothetical protein COEREDRAFT_89812 [Coemansia reversa NRRL 1564]|eukprot:PIA13113.1 hypothetical protein COEREDRAFT_89812 [Coemansia reversa NRRL 1564]